MNTGYITDRGIDQMAQAALRSYEMTADWNSARIAARDYAFDELNTMPNPTALLLALQIAKVKWAAIVQYTNQQIAQEKQS